MTSPDPAEQELARRLAEAEARAEHAERLATLGRLLAGVVHELNNPLTAVTMYAEVLASGLADPADREKAAAILDGGQRIQRICRELVGYARPQAAPDGLHALSALVDAAVQLARPDLKASGARLERADAAVQVRGRRESLVQVILALLANAAAAGHGHRVAVAMEAVPGGARLTVADEGGGMPAEVLARAFEPFFTTEPEKRLGLGLTTARIIVERHGGQVLLTSAPGRGTTATVILSS